MWRYLLKRLVFLPVVLWVLVTLSVHFIDLFSPDVIGLQFIITDWPCRRGASFMLQGFKILFAKSR